tara:strand:- start:5502 stop:6701 length:1200 start_codon:yes stop_codon:yes gene_type:complete
MLTAKAFDVVGVGPQLQVVTPNKELNQVVERRWIEWSKAVELNRKLRLFYEAKVCDGEAFMQRINNPRLRSLVQVDILLTEADLWTDPAWDQGELNAVDGIRFDDARNPISYTRLKHHPGEDTSWEASLDADTIPADDVVHWFRKMRPDQQRGIPEFTSALPLFAELRRYRLATIAAAEVAADLSAVMYSDAPAFGEKPDEVEEFGDVSLERRAMITLPAGWKMHQFRAEQPTNTFGEFSDQILKEIGRAVQMPLNIVCGSSRDYNFSSGRLDYLLYWNNCDVERSECASVVLDRVFDWWLAEANAIPGYLPTSPDTPIRENIRWIFPPRRPIDEVKAAQADQIRWAMGHLTDDDWAKREQVDLDIYYEQLRSMIAQRNAIAAPTPGDQNNGQETQIAE